MKTATKLPRYSGYRTHSSELTMTLEERSIYTPERLQSIRANINPKCVMKYPRAPRASNIFRKTITLCRRATALPDVKLLHLINLSFATFFSGALQLTNGPAPRGSIKYATCHIRHCDTIYVYVEMDSRGEKCPVSRSVLERPHESQ